MPEMKHNPRNEKTVSLHPLRPEEAPKGISYFRVLADVQARAIMRR